MFLNTGPGFRFTEATEPILGTTPDLARVIKARDLNGDGFIDIVVGTTYQTQSRLFLQRERGRFTEVTQTHLPAMPLSVGDLEPGDVDGDGDLDLVLADWGPGNNMSNDGGRTRLWLNDGAGPLHRRHRRADARPARSASHGISSSRMSTTTPTSTSSSRASAAAAAACSATTARGTFADDSARPAAVHQQLRVRGDGSRRRWLSRSRDNERRRDRRREQLEPARARLQERRQGPLPRRHRRVVAAGAQRRRGRQHGGLPRLRLRRRRRLRRRIAERAGSTDRQRRPRPPHRAARRVRRRRHAGHARPRARRSRRRRPHGRGAGPGRAQDGDRRARLRGPWPRARHRAAVSDDGQRRQTSRNGRDSSAPASTIARARACRPNGNAWRWSGRRTTGTRETPMRWYGEYLWRAEWPTDIVPATPFRVCATDAAGNTTCAGVR